MKAQTPATKKVDKALVNILLSQPFYSHLAGKMDIHPDAQVKTATTNGKYIKFNPQFIEGLTPEEIRGVLAHEVEHVARLHPFRRGNRDLETWQKATDFEINGHLIEAGFTLPDGHLYDPRFKDQPAERIYSTLKDEAQEGDPSPNAKPQDQGNDAGPGQPQPGNGPSNPETPTRPRTAHPRPRKLWKRRGLPRRQPRRHGPGRTRRHHKHDTGSPGR